MNLFRATLLPMAAALLLLVPSSGFGQDADKNQQDKTKNMSMTGCLSKDASGAFVITDETSGAKTTVTGVSDLEKHSANHKVTLTGKMSADSSGRPVFEATRLQHVSDTCKAPQ
jgi:hypothetical protein